MEVKEMITKEIKEEVVKSMWCDNCKKQIEHHGACGFGAKYTLSDAWCGDCGGKTYHLCTLECLKKFTLVLSSEKHAQNENAHAKDTDVLGDEQ
jgi:YHS domain-containing protein